MTDDECQFPILGQHDFSCPAIPATLREILPLSLMFSARHKIRVVAKNKCGHAFTNRDNGEQRH